MAGEIIAWLVAEKGAPALPRAQIVTVVGQLASLRNTLQGRLDSARTARNADPDLAARGAFEQEMQTLAALVRAADGHARQLADMPPLIDQLAQVEASVGAALGILP